MAKGRGRVHLTALEVEERKNFFLQRLKGGFSRVESQKQFANHYGCTLANARIWYNKCCDELVCDDIKERKRIRFGIIELYHAQVTAFSKDLVDISKEIANIDNIAGRRELLLAQLQAAPYAESQKIAKQLEALPEISPTTKSSLIESKSRIRERMLKPINELARIQGVTGVLTSWQQALNVLLDNDLLPPSAAEQILQLINNLESGLVSEETQEIKEAENGDSTSY